MRYSQSERARSRRRLRRGLRDGSHEDQLVAGYSPAHCLLYGGYCLSDLQL